MDLNSITVSDFKAQFMRDFPYLPVWVAGSYNMGEEVYYTPTRLFYTANSNGVTSTPDTVLDWTVTQDSINNFVQDSDITRAFQEAQVVFNQALFSTDPQIQMAYLYVTAHYLVNDILASMNAFATGVIGILSARTVGSVSESYSIPQKYLDNPVLAGYTKSAYGIKYLSMVLPKLVGNFGVVAGATLP